jgi:hypothetical protein
MPEIVEQKAEVSVGPSSGDSTTEDSPNGSGDDSQSDPAESVALTESSPTMQAGEPTKTAPQKGTKGRLSDEDAKLRDARELELVRKYKDIGDLKMIAYITGIPEKRVFMHLITLARRGEHDLAAKTPESCSISQVGKTASGMPGSPFKSDSYVSVELKADQLILTLVKKLI